MSVDQAAAGTPTEEHAGCKPASGVPPAMLATQWQCRRPRAATWAGAVADHPHTICANGGAKHAPARHVEQNSTAAAAAGHIPTLARSQSVEPGSCRCIV